MLGIEDEFPIKTKMDTEYRLYMFYPKDFTFVCPTELVRLKSLTLKFMQESCEIFACSTDSDEVHQAWRNSDERLKELPFPILSDGAHILGTALGIIKNGYAQRVLYIHDKNYKIKYIQATSDNVGRNIREAYRVLKALKTEELCPVEWKPGTRTLE